MVIRSSDVRPSDRASFVYSRAIGARYQARVMASRSDSIRMSDRTSYMHSEVFGEYTGLPVSAVLHCSFSDLFLISNEIMAGQC